MALHNDVALIQLGLTTAESLPDPTTVNGRIHELWNDNAATAVWTAPGATPFLVDGVAVASLSVPSGGSVRVRSDGTRWVAVRPQGARRVFAASAVTDSGGQVVFTFTPPFSAVPVVSATAQPGAVGVNGHFCEIEALSASSCTVQGWQGRGVLVGGQTTDQSGAGVTIHLWAAEAGQGV